MPKKVESMEAKMVRHFSEVSLGVAEAQLGMLGAIVKRRAESVSTVPNGGARPQQAKGPQAAGQVAKPAGTKKGPRPKDVEIPGTRIEDGPGIGTAGRVGD